MGLCFPGTQNSYCIQRVLRCTWNSWVCEVQLAMAVRSQGTMCL